MRAVLKVAALDSVSFWEWQAALASCYLMTDEAGDALSQTEAILVWY